MRIGIWTDSREYPNIPLMKISAYHKRMGDQVEWLNHLQHYDRVYCSKVFGFTPDVDADCMVYADEIVRGGTGYHIRLVDGREQWVGEDQPLPQEIEHMCPDYDLFPENKNAIGFLTRGCPRNCGFCVVSKKEGRCSRQVASLDEWYRGQREITKSRPNGCILPGTTQKRI